MKENNLLKRFLEALPYEIEKDRIATEKKHRAELYQALSDIQKNEKKGYTSLSQDDIENTVFDNLIINKDNELIINKFKEWDPLINTKAAIIIGKPGNGKSTLCKCLINKHANKNFRCIFILTSELLTNLKSQMGNNELDYNFELNKYINCDLLVFDDLGAEKHSDWSLDTILLIFDKRINLKKFTFFTTNLCNEEIFKRYGARFFDRILLHNKEFQLKGESFRRIIGNQSDW